MRRFNRQDSALNALGRVATTRGAWAPVGRERLERVDGLVDTLQPEDTLSQFGNRRSANDPHECGRAGAGLKVVLPIDFNVR